MPLVHPLRARRGRAAAVALALATTLAMPLAIADARGADAATAGGSSSVVQVNTGRGRLVTLSRPMSDVFVADETIADVQVRSPTQLYIFGKKTGETTISATTRGGAVVYATTVRVGNNLDSIAAMLQLAMPDARLVATPMNGIVLLTGTVAGPGDAAEAERLVQAYVGDATKVLSRLKTATPLQVNLQVRIAEVSNLTALSGETATFLAGGEIPIPLAGGLGTVTVEYKQYGVSLAYTPTVLSDGRISLRVRPEVSQIDNANAVTVGGTRVPGITTRRAETTLELGSGQSMMIGGLLSNSHGNNIDKTPFLGDLPIIGSLFRSTNFQRNETELVIIITPYLVKPVSNPAQIALPHDGYRAPSDAARILLGEVGGGGNGPRPVPTMIPGDPPSAPTIGAAAAVPPVPQRQPAPAAADPRATSKKKGAVPAPGFSN
ncbi:MAG: type II and III secretion system protein family protein [Sphingomonas sp.]|nr:MAG: type II and III secretion system protein family protein [Sphingomonas sp.]